MYPSAGSTFLQQTINLFSIRKIRKALFSFVIKQRNIHGNSAASHGITVSFSHLNAVLNCGREDAFVTVPDRVKFCNFVFHFLLAIFIILGYLSIIPLILFTQAVSSQFFSHT